MFGLRIALCQIWDLPQEEDNTHRNYDVVTWIGNLGDTVFQGKENAAEINHCF